MREIKPPFNIPSKVRPKVFLCGSIEMGNATQWQKEASELLKDTDFLVLNPRREDWDSSWVQSKDNEQFLEQVSWELQGLEQSDYVIVYFDKDSSSPITLLELGLISQNREQDVVVVCPQGFYRKGNVDIVCDRYGLYQADSLEQAVNYIKTQEWGSRDEE